MAIVQENTSKLLQTPAEIDLRTRSDFVFEYDYCELGEEVVGTMLGNKEYDIAGLSSISRSCAVAIFMEVKSSDTATSNREAKAFTASPPVACITRTESYFTIRGFFCLQELFLLQKRTGHPGNPPPVRPEVATRVYPRVSSNVTLVELTMALDRFLASWNLYLVEAEDPGPATTRRILRHTIEISSCWERNPIYTASPAWARVGVTKENAAPRSWPGDEFYLLKSTRPLEPLQIYILRQPLAPTKISFHG